MSICLQKSASIRPRTSPAKFTRSSWHRPSDQSDCEGADGLFGRDRGHDTYGSLVPSRNPDLPLRVQQRSLDPAAQRAGKETIPNFCLRSLTLFCQFFQRLNLHLSRFWFFLELLVNELTSGNYLEFPAIHLYKLSLIPGDDFVHLFLYWFGNYLIILMPLN